jgi:hypothetical protein
MKIKKRKEPIPEPAELVYAWLETWEGEPPTPDELHRSKGDGLSLPAIREALFWLEERCYVQGGQLRTCKVTGRDNTPFQILAPLLSAMI